MSGRRVRPAVSVAEARLVRRTRTRKSLGTVALIVSSLHLMTGCAASDSERVEEESVSQASVTTSEVATSTTIDTRQADIEALRANLVGFEDATWYANIVDFEPSYLKTVAIKTDLGDGPAGTAKAKDICSWASGHIYAHTTQTSFKGVRVVSKDGLTIVQRLNFNDPCD